MKHTLLFTIIWVLIIGIYLTQLFGCTTTQPIVATAPISKTCPQTAFYGTGDPPDQADLDQATYSKGRCKDLYGPDACLISLTKKAPRTYWAICRRTP